MAQNDDSNFTPPVDDLRSTEDIPRDYLKYAQPATAEQMTSAQESPAKQEGREKLKARLETFLEQTQAREARVRKRHSASASRGASVTRGQTFMLIILTLFFFGVGAYIGDGIGLIVTKDYNAMCKSWQSKPASSTANSQNKQYSAPRENSTDSYSNQNRAMPRKIKPDVYIPPQPRLDPYRKNTPRNSPPVKYVPRSDRW